MSDQGEQTPEREPCPHCGRTNWRWSGECHVGLMFSPEDRMEVRCDYCKPLRMEAYYYSFGSTGVELIDRILSAVAQAGKGYHYTEGWIEPVDDWGPFRGGDYASWIQCAANDAASALRAAEARGKVQGLREAAAVFDETESEMWRSYEVRDWLMFKADALEQETTP